MSEGKEQAILDKNNATSVGKRIVVIGPVGGGTVFYGHDYLLGLYRMLKEADESELPDVMVWNGGVLPEVPKYGTKGAKSRQLALESRINVLDDAVVALKQDLDRIMGVIEERKPGMKVYYVAGYEDKENLNGRNHDRLMTACNYSPRDIYLIKNTYRNRIEENEQILGSVKKQMELKRKELRRQDGGNGSGAARMKMIHKISTLKQKIRQQTEETADYRELVKKYTDLQKEWIKHNSTNNLEEIIKIFGNEDGELERELDRYYRSVHEHIDLNGIRARYKELDKKLKEKLDENIKKKPAAGKPKSAESDDPRAISRLEEQVKKLANIIRKYGYKEIDAEKAMLVKSEPAGLKAGERFTHNTPANHDYTAKADEISALEIMLHIKGAFGRKHALDIVMGNMKDISVGGAGVRLTNNATNISNMARKDIDRKMETLLNIAGREGERVDLVIGGFGPVGEVKAVATVDKGGRTFEVITPPLVNVAALGDLWNRKAKMAWTQMYEGSKFTVSSGIWDIRFDELHPEFTYLTKDELAEFAEREKTDQTKVMVSRLRSLAPAKVDTKIDDKDVLQMRHEIPSELNKELLTKFLIHNGINPSDKDGILELADDIEKRGGYGHLQPYDVLASNSFPDSKAGEDWKPAALKLKGIADLHVGHPGEGQSAPDFLRAYVAYELGKKGMDEDVALLLAGDIVDGGYKNFNQEKGTDWNKTDEIRRFRAGLERKGLAAGSEAYLGEVVKYEAYLLRKQPVYSLTDQMVEFRDAVAPLLEKASAVIVVGGNHFNKESKASNAGRDDETSATVAAIEPYVAGGPGRIMQMHGGNYGIGRGHINGIGIFATHKATSQIFTDLRTTEPIAVAGDAHVFRIQVVGNRALFTMPAGCGPSDFPTQINIPTSQDLRGFLDLDVTFYAREGADGEKDAKIKRFTAAPVFANALEPFMELKRDAYIVEHERNRNRVEMPALADCARDRHAPAKAKTAKCR
jgi:hypothetical protein